MPEIKSKLGEAEAWYKGEGSMLRSTVKSLVVVAIIMIVMFGLTSMVSADEPVPSVQLWAKPVVAGETQLEVTLVAMSPVGPAQKEFTLTGPCADTVIKTNDLGGAQGKISLVGDTTKVGSHKLTVKLEVSKGQTSSWEFPWQIIPGAPAVAKVNETKVVAGDPIVLAGKVTDAKGNEIEAKQVLTITIGAETLEAEATPKFEVASSEIVTKTGKLPYTVVTDKGTELAKGEVEIVVGEPEQIEISAPAEVIAGESFQVIASGQDKFGNSADGEFQFTWVSASSNGNAKGKFGQSVVIFAGAAGEEIVFTAKVGKVEAKTTIKVVEKAAETSGLAAPASGGNYTVVQGDYLWKLWETNGNGVSWAEWVNALRALNGNQIDHLVPGMTLTMP
ncbi:MAG: LysM peptidoglycan-binding domain-containing protein [Patescibacteria group bacterium]|jgi:hypothetical protein